MEVSFSSTFFLLTCPFGHWFHIIISEWIHRMRVRVCVSHIYNAQKGKLLFDYFRPSGAVSSYAFRDRCFFFFSCLSHSLWWISWNERNACVLELAPLFPISIQQPLFHYFRFIGSIFRRRYMSWGSRASCSSSPISRWRAFLPVSKSTMQKWMENSWNKDRKSIFQVNLQLDSIESQSNRDVRTINSQVDFHLFHIRLWIASVVCESHMWNGPTKAFVSLFLSGFIFLFHLVFVANIVGIESIWLKRFDSIWIRSQWDFSFTLNDQIQVTV